MISAVVHGVVFIATGGPWEGPVSWRKPILFGFSFGITAITIAFIATALNLRRRTSWIVLGALAVSSTLETALITLQTWRGVPSHFNFSTVFDTSIFIAMGVFVMIVALSLLWLAVLSFTALRPIAPSLGWAIRAAMVLLIVAQVLGVLIITTGVVPAVMGDEDTVFGPNGVTIGVAGVLKSPHGIALHALQVLPALALLAQCTRWDERRRMLATGSAIVGYALLVAVSTIQAFTGHTPLGLSTAMFPLILVAVLLVVPAVAMVISFDWRRFKAW